MGWNFKEKARSSKKKRRKKERLQAQTRKEGKKRCSNSNTPIGLLYANSLYKLYQPLVYFFPSFLNCSQEKHFPF
jgi:hypothetical protein